AGQDLSDRETVLREPDRRREHLLTRQPAEPLMRGEESRDVAGHPDDAQVGTAVVAGTSAEPLDRLHRVEVEVLRALRVVQPDQHGTATADAGHLRLDHADRECRGDCGVDCVAAGAQHLDAGLTRERTRRRDRAVGTDRHAANLPRGRLQDTLLRCGRGARRDNEHPRDPAYDRRPCLLLFWTAVRKRRRGDRRGRRCPDAGRPLRLPAGDRRDGTGPSTSATSSTRTSPRFCARSCCSTTVRSPTTMISTFAGSTYWRATRSTSTGLTASTRWIVSSSVESGSS